MTPLAQWLIGIVRHVKHSFLCADEVQLYLEGLRDLTPAELARAREHVVQNYSFLPTVKEIRAAAGRSMPNVPRLHRPQADESVRRELRVGRGPEIIPARKVNPPSMPPDEFRDKIRDLARKVKSL